MLIVVIMNQRARTKEKGSIGGKPDPSRMPLQAPLNVGMRRNVPNVHIPAISLPRSHIIDMVNGATTGAS